MSLLRAAFYSLLFVVGALAAVVAWLVLSNVPAGLRYTALSYMAEGCTSPETLPANAGARLVVDLRAKEDGGNFADTPVQAFIDGTLAQLRTGSDAARDLVIYVHGFNTSLKDAACAGAVLQAELAGLPPYAGAGPDILVFGWPGEVGPFHFNAAKGNAARAGAVLGSILRQLPERRIILVSHSLGAQVVMTAAGMLPDQDGKPPLAGMLLIQGAIPAVSIREWTSKFTLSHPAADLEDLRMGRPYRPPLVENVSRRGDFVAASERAAHLVVTTAGDDIPLANFFTLDETFRPQDMTRPLVPPQVGDSAGNGIDIHPLGTPFPNGKVYRMYEEKLPEPPAAMGYGGQGAGSEIPSLRPTDPSRVLSRAEWEFTFRVPHPAYHEIRLGGGQWWRLLFDWHGVMNDPPTRRHILQESWAVFGGPDAGLSPRRPAR